MLTICGHVLAGFCQLVTNYSCLERGTLKCETASIRLAYVAFFFINDWCSKAQLWVAPPSPGRGAGQEVLDGIRKVEQCSSVLFSPYMELLTRLTPFDEGLQCLRSNKPFPPQLAFGHGSYHNTMKIQLLSVKSQEDDQIWQTTHHRGRHYMWP